MGCCDDPTEPKKLDRRDLIRVQEEYGNLARDLFTEDPEKVLLRLLENSSVYLRELAALRAHYPAVRLRAIKLLGKDNHSVLKQIIDQEPNSEFARAALVRVEELNSKESGFLGKMLNSVFN
jgi:hypothetical protein